MFPVFSLVLADEQSSDNKSQIRMLVPGTVLSSGRFQIHELAGIMQIRVNANQLPWDEVRLLPRPDNDENRGIVPLISGQVRVWSEYYRSSFYISDSAGMGAYGEVWRGFMLDGPKQTPIVLKRVFSHKGMQVLSSSMREVYFGSHLGQERVHISRLISHFVEDHDLWLVFYDEGISLYQAIFHPVFVNGLSIMYRSFFWEQTRKEPNLTMRIIRQILLGLVDLHALGITHRDIKLENIFIEPGTGHVRIGDFGSAARGSDGPEMLQSLFPPNGPSLQEETSRYAPPERSNVSPDSPLGVETSFDMWSVGILWLELILGTIDLGLDERKGICVRYPVCTDLGERIKTRDPYGQGITDAGVLELISHLLAFDPKMRPSALEALNHRVFSVDQEPPTVGLLAYDNTENRFRYEVRTALSQGGRSNMEDFIATASENGFRLVCVFDGHNGGSVSKFLSEELPKTLFGLSATRSLRQALRLVTDRVALFRDQFSPLEGSTACCALINEISGQVEVLNIGDSRLIVVESVSDSVWQPEVGGRVRFGPDLRRNGRVVEIRDNVVIVTPDGQEHRRTVAKKYSPESDQPVRTRQISLDHKPDSPGEITYIESHGGFVSGSPARVNGILAISRSIGVQELSRFVRSEADFFSLSLTKSTKRLVIATDGIWDVLSNQEVAELSETGPDEVINEASRRGGRDNMAVAILDIISDSLIRVDDEL